MTLHTPIEADNPLTRSNDSRVHPCGAFWIGTMAKDEEKGAGSIYWFFKGELRRLFSDITVSNSICFSQDGAIAYYTDTSTGLLMRVACDPATGLPAGEPKVFVDHRSSKGYVDGSVVDRDGVLWNAVWGGKAVKAYSPDGTLLREVAMPVTQSSCPAFVGAKADRLAVTSAWKGKDDEAAQARPAGRHDLPARHSGQRPLRAARADRLIEPAVGRCHAAVRPGRFRESRSRSPCDGRRSAAGNRSIHAEPQAKTDPRP